MAELGEIKVDIKLNTEEIIKELKSVQREAKKATQAVKEFESLSVSKNVEYNLAKEALDYSIKLGVLMTDLNDNLRAIGKTNALIVKAHELDVPIIVGNSMTMKSILNIAREKGLEIKCYNGNHIDELRGKRFTNQSFLVDDTVTNKIILELQSYGFKCIGGFNSLQSSIK